jgi:hypothetical protein
VHLAAFGPSWLITTMLGYCVLSAYGKLSSNTRRACWSRRTRLGAAVLAAAAAVVESPDREEGHRSGVNWTISQADASPLAATSSTTRWLLRDPTPTPPYRDCLLARRRGDRPLAVLEVVFFRGHLAVCDQVLSAVASHVGPPEPLSPGVPGDAPAVEGSGCNHAVRTLHHQDEPE